MSTTSPAGLAEISAPLPKPRPFTLLDTALTPPTDNERWLGGAWVEGYPTGPAYTHDPCSSGTARQKAEAGTINNPVAGTFTVYLPVSCDSRAFMPNPDRMTERLELIFAA